MKGCSKPIYIASGVYVGAPLPIRRKNNCTEVPLNFVHVLEIEESHNHTFHRVYI
jgi:hypothetical protein